MSNDSVVTIEEVDDDRGRYRIILDKGVVVFGDNANEAFGIICGFHAGKKIRTEQPLSILVGPLVDQSSPAFQENYREGERLRSVSWSVRLWTRVRQLFRRASEKDKDFERKRR